MSTLFSDYLSLSAVILVVGMYAINVYCAVHEEQSEDFGHTAHHMQSHSCGH